MQIYGLSQMGASGTQQTVEDSQSFVGPNDFFKILSAQLQYQDPMSGEDPGEHIMQMSQFAMIEKMDQMLQEFENLYNLNASGQATDLVGREVKLETLEQGEAEGIVEKVEITPSGLHYWVNGDRYEQPRILEIGGLVNSQEEGVEPDDTQNGE